MLLSGEPDLLLTVFIALVVVMLFDHDVTGPLREALGSAGEPSGSADGCGRMLRFLWETGVSRLVLVEAEPQMNGGHCFWQDRHFFHFPFSCCLFVITGFSSF